MRFKLSLTVGAAALLAASPALAQSTPTPAPTPTPSPAPSVAPKLPPKPHVTPDGDNRYTPGRYQTAVRNEVEDVAFARELEQNAELHANSYRWASKVAQCIVGSEGAAAAELIEFDGEQFVRRLNTRHLPCVQGQTRQTLVDVKAATPATMTAALAEQLIMIEGLEFDPRSLDVDVDEVEAFSGVVPGANIGLAMIGRCAAAYSPGLVQGVFAQKPGSDAEAKALDTLYSSTPECGLTARPDAVPATRQRAALALGLYDWLHRS